MTPSRPPSKDETAASAPFPFPTAENHSALPVTSPRPVTETPTEDALDHGIEESFPASDPVSVSVTKAVAKPEPGEPDASHQKGRSR